MKFTRVLFVLFSPLFFFVLGCASSGAIKETQALNAPLGKYKVVWIQLEKNNIPKEDLYSNKFLSILKNELEKTGLFETIHTEQNAQAPLKLTAKFLAIDEPSEAVAILVGTMANSEVKLDVNLSETKPATRKLCSLEVSGNSKNRYRTSVGGVSITGGSDYTVTAMEEAAERIALYIRERQ